MSYKQHFQRCCRRLRIACTSRAHSHHLWPDVSFVGHVQAWLDAATFADQKWPKIMAELIPRAQAHVAKRLGLADG